LFLGFDTIPSACRRRKLNPLSQSLLHRGNGANQEVTAAKQAISPALELKARWNLLQQQLLQKTQKTSETNKLLFRVRQRPDQITTGEKEEEKEEEETLRNNTSAVASRRSERRVLRRAPDGSWLV
jgi:predicted Zn-dependent protease